MPTVQLDPKHTMYYEDDYFGDPWGGEPEVVLMIHGVAESSVQWTGWVPRMSRRFRLLRVDQRGLGRSSAPTADWDYTPASYARDLARFLDAMGVASAHIVGAKFGGTVALQFAADFPERTRTLSVISPLVRGRGMGTVEVGNFADTIRSKGMRAWAEETQRARLGSAASDAHIAWWNDLMANSSAEVCIGLTSVACVADLYSVLPRIKARTLIITTEFSPLQSVDKVKEWQALIPNASRIVMSGDFYHPAAVRPEECAESVFQFITRAD